MCCAVGDSKSEDEVKIGKYVKLNEIIFYVFIKAFFTLTHLLDRNILLHQK